MDDQRDYAEEASNRADMLNEAESERAEEILTSMHKDYELVAWACVGDSWTIVGYDTKEEVYIVADVEHNKYIWICTYHAPTKDRAMKIFDERRKIQRNRNFV